MDDILDEAFAVVREASWRVLKLRHYDVQMVGGMVLHDGRCDPYVATLFKLISCMFLFRPDLSKAGLRKWPLERARHWLLPWLPT